MKCLLAVLFIFVVASPSLCARIISDVSPSFNVVNYGAKGDGETDDSQAFLQAWGDVCNATQGTPTLFIPQGKTFLLQPVLFQGPCTPAAINVQLQGTIIAPSSADAWNWPTSDRGAWVRFSYISGLVVNGGGQIDGQGAAWWNCGPKGDCDRPTALHFHRCENLQLSGLTHINSPRNHIGLNECNGSYVTDLLIFAPEDSPNTDGIDISASSNVVIYHSTMATGDDCIAINGGSSFINITGVTCGPGHGISVGSLGRNGAYDTVEEVHVRNCTFNGTSNGARIKTFQGGSGYARKIKYEDITLIAAKNPVIIDQEYDPGFTVVGATAVQVSDVTFRNFTGTSANEDAIKLDCDPTIGCNNIVVENIDITCVAGKTFSSCINAHGRSSSSIPDVSCFS